MGRDGESPPPVVTAHELVVVPPEGGHDRLRALKIDTDEHAGQRGVVAVEFNEGLYEEMFDRQWQHWAHRCGAVTPSTNREPLCDICRKPLPFAGYDKSLRRAS